MVSIFYELFYEIYFCKTGPISFFSTRLKRRITFAINSGASRRWASFIPAFYDSNSHQIFLETNCNVSAQDSVEFFLWVWEVQPYLSRCGLASVLPLNPCMTMPQPANINMRELCSLLPFPYAPFSICWCWGLCCYEIFNFRRLNAVSKWLNAALKFSAL